MKFLHEFLLISKEIYQKHFGVEVMKKSKLKGIMEKQM